MSSELDAIHEFVRAHQDASSTHVQEWTCGHALFHSGLPLVYDLNFLRLESPCERTAGEIASEAEKLLAAPAFTHRQVGGDSSLAAPLLDGFKELGWKVNEHVVMVHRRAPDRPADTSEVQPVDDPTVWPARERFLRTYEWCNSPDTVAQMHAAYRIWLRSGDGIDLAVSRDGGPVSFAMLWRRDGIAQIEDVATLEPYRNQGLSRAVVSRALEIARGSGCEVIFLIADADDWPRTLYEKLGFDPVGTYYYFLKTNS